MSIDEYDIRMYSQDSNELNLKHFDQEENGDWQEADLVKILHPITKVAMKMLQKVMRKLCINEMEVTDRRAPNSVKANRPLASPT